MVEYYINAVIVLGSTYLYLHSSATILLCIQYTYIVSCVLRTSEAPSLLGKWGRTRFSQHMEGSGGGGEGEESERGLYTFSLHTNGLHLFPSIPAYPILAIPYNRSSNMLISTWCCIRLPAASDLLRSRPHSGHIVK